MFGNRENNLLRRALELYAGKDVLAGVLSEGEAFLFPHARNVELTMLFFDIASVAERGDGLDAVALGDYVTTYAEAMTNAVADTGGTFDTFIGDSGSAWWGVRGEPAHADQALSCARKLLHAAERLNNLGNANMPLISLKIGIHSGLVSLGSFGSSTRLRHTVMGNAVNLASRLCGIAPDYSTHVLLSEATHLRLKDASCTTYLDSVRVKGKDEPVRIYRAAF